MSDSAAVGPRMGSVWVEKKGKVYRFEGDFPNDLAPALTAKGAFYNEGAWWVREEAWTGVERLFTAAGIAVGTDRTTLPTRHAEFMVNSIGEIVIEGALPRNLPSWWLGRTTARGYRGLCPFLLPEALETFRKENIEPKLAPGVRRLLEDVEGRMMAVEAVLDGTTPLPTVTLEDGTLWDFQRQTLAFAEATDGRFLLGDDPGTGKSVQSIALSRYVMAEKVLVTGPAIAKWNWARMVKKFDGADAHVMVGLKGPSIPFGTRWLIANYDILRGREDQIRAWDPDLVIYDESHLLKNKDAKRSIAAKEFARRARRVVLLTGTPIWSYPIDLWNQLDTILPNWWGRWFDFGVAFAAGTKKRWGYDFRGSSNENVLHRLLRYVVLRRTKADVLKDLPSKTRTIYPVDLAPTFRREYDDKYAAFKELLVKSQARAEGESLGPEAGKLLAMRGDLLRLSSKGRIGATVETILEVVQEEKKPVVVFAAWLDSLHDIEAALKAEGLRVGVVWGDVSPEKRFALAEQFQRGELDVFLAQIDAAGVAIDLFRADTTITHDLVWSPFALLQAEDRVNRIGQTDRTRHLYMVGKDTLDDKVVERIMKKLAGNKSVLETGEAVDKELLREIRDEFFQEEAA